MRSAIFLSCAWSSLSSWSYEGRWTGTGRRLQQSAQRVSPRRVQLSGRADGDSRRLRLGLGQAQPGDPVLGQLLDRLARGLDLAQQRRPLAVRPVLTFRVDCEGGGRGSQPLSVQPRSGPGLGTHGGRSSARGRQTTPCRRQRQHARLGRPPGSNRGGRVSKRPQRPRRVDEWADEPRGD